MLKMQQKYYTSFVPWITKRNIFLLSRSTLLLLILLPFRVDGRPQGPQPNNYPNASLKKVIVSPLPPSRMAPPPPPLGNPITTKTTSKLRIKRQTETGGDFNLEDDIVQIIEFSGDSSDSDIFDIRRQDTHFCNLCIWVQPNYAVHHGFGSVSAGISEILEVIKLLNWIFRAMDINMDGLPDSIGLVVGEILVQDLPITKGSNLADASTTVDTEDGYGTVLKYSTAIGKLVPSTTLSFLEKALASKFQTQQCCATLAFIYHDVPNLLSFSTLRGLCQPGNIAVITGYKAGPSLTKIGLYDVFRATFHALGHLFGASHDRESDLNCVDKNVVKYRNPFVMEPAHYLNVGMRPNSMRLSPCAKARMALFLASSQMTCLTLGKEAEAFCGNGITEEGEDCDCGAPWQCLLAQQCCGPRNSFTPCKVKNTIQALKRGKCSRPKEW